LSLTRVNIGRHEVTRLVVGGNPFSGFSHQSAERNKEMADYYTAERIKATLRACEECGINAFVGRGDRHIMRALNEYWNEGGRLKWIGQQAPEWVPIEKNIREIADHGAIGCYLHGGVVDHLFAEGKLDSAREYLALMKDLGMVPGMAAHNPQVPLYAEEHRLGAEFYLVCFYNLTLRGGDVYLPEDREAAVKTIQQIRKPCIAFKVLAAGRNNPEEAFTYAYRNIKPTDLVCVGVYTKHHPRQVQENVNLVQRLLKAASQPSETR